MNGDELIQTCREIGFDCSPSGVWLVGCNAQLEELCKRVAAAEREACAALLERDLMWRSNLSSAALIRARGEV